MDPNKFGFIPDSSTTFALISILHHWSEATDGTGAHVRVALLDYKKAFELVDHNLLMPRRARSAVSVITECEAREPHTPAGRVWRENDCRHFIQRIRKKRGSYNVTEVTEIS